MAANQRGIVMISTRLTKFFDIEHPIILAPMTPAAGADLAAAVAAAGGLGLLGGGYGDRSWFETESAKITRNDVGCGFITWSVAQQPDLLDFAIERHSRAIMLSFADPAPFAPRIKQAGVPLICQVHRPSPTSSRCQGRCCRGSRHGSGRPRPNSPVDVAVRADGGGRSEQTCPRCHCSCCRRYRGWARSCCSSHAGRRGGPDGQPFLGDTGGTYPSQRKGQGGGSFGRRDDTNQRVRYRKAKGVAGRIHWAASKERIHRKVARPRREAQGPTG